MTRARALGAGMTLASAALVALACAGGRPDGPPEPAPAAKDVETTLFLLGDAGAPAPEPLGEPVLRALRGDATPASATPASATPASATPASATPASTIVFLGDNVYPRGLPAESAPDRAEAERRLDGQIAVMETGARVVFLPGNHDWARHGKDGWAAVKRQEKRVRAAGVEFWPGGGCPGPKVLDLARRVRLVLLDTQWWLHAGPKPVDASSGCAAFTEAGVVNGIREAIATAGERKVIVLAHHPIASGGEHGGYFTVTEHLFPLRGLWRPLWIPLPFVGSIYPVARQLGVATRQDLANRRHQQLLAALDTSFTPKAPDVYASGHEHNLQVLKGERVRHVLISGAGIYGQTSPVSRSGATRFALSKGGFMKLEVTERGELRLAVRVANADGTSKEVYSTWLD